MKPLCIDLYCGLGGWSEGALAEGYRVVGFDIERHVYGPQRYPAQLVLQDVTTLHGSQFKDAALIVASPPCQQYSYMAMPWKRAKRAAEYYLGANEDWSVFGDGVDDRDDEAEYRERRRAAVLNLLFDTCFRLQREASQAAGRRVPLIVENVRGAEKWVGSARWHFGSFYLWGDVPALMPATFCRKVVTKYARPGSWKSENGDDWRSARNAGLESEGIKQHGSGAAWFDKALDERRKEASGLKAGKDWLGGYGGIFGWDCSPMRRNNSHSTARKAASAQIAKIPFELARYIAHVYKP